jgi:hypothetical protein
MQNSKINNMASLKLANALQNKPKKISEINDSIVITDPTIVKFFKENPSLNPEMTIGVFVDIMKKLSVNLSETINTSTNGKIMKMLTDLSGNVLSIKQEMNRDLTETFYKFKTEYMEEMKLNLTNTTLSNNEKLHAILEKNSASLIDKTHLLINEVIPKSNDQVYRQIDGCLAGLKNSIKQETESLLNNVSRDERSFKEYYEMIERQIGKMIVQVQEPVIKYIQGSEERTTTNIRQIHEKVSENHQTQSGINENLSIFFNRYTHNSSIRGAVSENELNFLLQSMYPSDEVLDVGKQTATCDFRLNRRDETKPTILFENKDYAGNVPTSEVEKFERDLQMQKKHGIFISQSSGITYKTDFQLDIKNNLIHLYIPKCEYSAEKIKMAVDMIDSLSPVLKSIQSVDLEGSFSLSADEITNMLNDHTNFETQKQEIVNMITSQSKILTEKIKTMHYKSVMKILEKNNLINIENKCNYCDYIGRNQAAVSAHKRKCPMMKADVTENVNGMDSYVVKKKK